jgi:hypothetical protein
MSPPYVERAFLYPTNGSVRSVQTSVLLVIYVLGHQKKDHGLLQIQYDESSEKNCDENA